MKEKSFSQEPTPISKSKRKPGRPRFEEKVSPGRVVRAYQTNKSLRKTSQVLGCDVKTLKRVLDSQGVEYNTLDKADMARYGAMSRRKGCFVKWLEAHPGEKLPCSITQISKKTGCPYDAVKSYLYRRRTKIKNLLKRLPDIRKLPGMFEDTLGLYVDPSSISKYYFKINKFSCDVMIRATLIDGTTTDIHVDKVANFSKRVEELLKSEV